MSRPWVDFVNLGELPISRGTSEFGTFTYREFANGTTRNEGRSSPIIAPGKSIMLELDGTTIINAHIAPVQIRAFIFEGHILFGDKELKERSYIEIAAGSKIPEVTSSGNAQIFITYDNEYKENSAVADKNEIIIKQMQDLVWQNPIVTDFPGGAARKAFYDQGEYGSAVLGILPEWDSPFYESHTFSEEILIVQGSIISSFGTMKRGAYLSHPGGADTEHGPIYSKEGCLMLVLRQGPVGNTFVPADPVEVASRRN